MAFGLVWRNYFHGLRANGFLFRGRRVFGLPVINKTGSTIAVDKLVCVSGYDITSKRPKVVLANAGSANLAGDVWVTTLAIKDGKQGNVFQGAMSTANLNTSGATTVGDPVYLDTTAGGFTSTVPPNTNARQVVVGYVQVKSSTVGQIAWDIAENSNKVASTDVNRTYGRAVAVAAAATASVATFTPAADGSFEVWMNVLPTTIGSGSFTCECSYTDESNVARVANIPFFLVGGTTATVATVSTGAPYQGIPLHIRVKAATAIILRTQAAGTYTGCTYNVEGAIEQLA